MTKNTGNDRAMSYVRKISLVAGSISALALMSTVKTARAAGLMETQNVSSGEITVDWDLDALETDDAILLADDHATDTTTGSMTTDTTTGSMTTDTTTGSMTTDTTTGSMTTDTTTGSMTTDTTTGSMTTDTTTGSMTTDTTTGSMTTDTTTGSMTTDTTTGETSGALPGDRVVATATFTFDVAGAASNLATLSVASNW